MVCLSILCLFPYLKREPSGVLITDEIACSWANWTPDRLSYRTSKGYDLSFIRLIISILSTSYTAKESLSIEP